MANLTLASATSTVIFSSIPATYRDLVLVISARTSSAATSDTVNLRFNGDIAANYAQVRLFNSGSTASSNTSASLTSLEIGRIPSNNSSNTTLGPVFYQVFDYAATNKFKSGLGRSGALPTESITDNVFGRWSSSAAITSITLTCSPGPNFAAGSTFALYGIVA